MDDRPVYLYVTPFFPREGRHFGSYSYDFVVELQRQSQYNVVVLVPGNGEDYVYRGVTVHTFKTRELPSSILPLLFRRYNTRSFLNKVKEVLTPIVHLHLPSSPDVLTHVKICHANTVPLAIYPLAIKRLNPACKALLHHHDLASCGLLTGRLRHNWLHKIIVWRGFRRLIEQIDLNIFISEAARRSLMAFPDTSWTVYEDYRRLGRGIGWMRPASLKRSYIMHNGVDTSLFTSEGRKPHEGFVVGCCANYRKMKDFPTLLAALAKVREQVPELKIRFMGELGHYPSDDALRQQIRELKLDDILEFLPAVDHSQLPDFYRSLDLFVMPSYYEGFGCVYTEAYACGTPFVGCEGQGIADVVAEVEAAKWLCVPKDVVSLSNLILRFYHQRDNQKIVGAYKMPELMADYLASLHTKVNDDNVGIVTIEKKFLLSNYGSFWQHYALREVLKRMGYRSYRVIRSDEHLGSWEWVYELLGRCVARPMMRWLSGSVKHPIQEIVSRCRIERAFRQDYTRLIGAVHEKQLIGNRVITGSDQVLASSDDEAWLLGRKEACRVAYAASADWNRFAGDRQLVSQAKRAVPAMSGVSVWEHSGAVCLRSISGSGCKVDEVFDPVMLLSRNEYKAILPPQCIFNGETLFGYLVNADNLAQIPFDAMQRMAKDDGLGLRILGAHGTNSVVPSEYRMFASPRDFLRCFRDAKYVITNSFHGVCFSIIFKKQFVYVRQMSDMGPREGVRQMEMLERCGLQSRYVEDFSYEKIHECLSRPIDWQTVDTRLAELIDYSMKWLQEHLERNEGNEKAAD